MAEEENDFLVVMANHPTPFCIRYLVNGLFSITLLLCSLALRERLKAGAPNRMRIAVIAASVASPLFLASFMILFIGLPDIVAANDLASYLILNAVTQGLLSSAVFAYAWATLLFGWAGLSTKELPSGLSYVLLLAGVFDIIGIGMMIFGPMGNVVWAFWLGYVLLNTPKATSTAKLGWKGFW